MQFNVTGSDDASVMVEAPNWMVAIGKAMAFFEVEADAMGRWVCVPQADGEVFIDDPVTKRSWSIVPVKQPTVVVVSPPSAVEPDDEPEPEPEPEPTGPPPVLSMPGRSTFAPERSEPSAAAEEPSAAADEPSAAAEDPADAAPEDLAERLFDLSFDITGADVEEACRRSLDLILEFVPCEAGSVLRGTLNDVALTFVAATGPVADSLIGRQVEWGTGLVGLCFDLGFPIEVHDVAHDERHDDALDEETGFTTREVLCVPVRNDVGTYGVIQLLNPPKGFADWHVDTVATVSRTLAGAFAST